MFIYLFSESAKCTIKPHNLFSLLKSYEVKEGNLKKCMYLKSELKRILPSFIPMLLLKRKYLTINGNKHILFMYKLVKKEMFYSSQVCCKF